MAIGFQFHPIHAARFHPFGSIGKILDDALNIPVLDLLRKGPVRRFPLMRWREDRQPVALVPAGTAAKMRQLDHDRRTRLMHGVGHFPDPRNDFILVGQEVVEDGRAVFRHGGRARRHRQRHAAPGPFDGIGAVAPFRHAVFRVGGFVGGDDDAVAQRQMLELIGLKKGIVRHVPAPKRV